MQTQIQEVPLEKINLFGGTQTRLKTNDDAVESYAEEMMRGTVFPPINVYFDGSTYWLADGFHRYLATKRNGGGSISAEVMPGGRTEALRHALGANATNGVYRTNGDKRNAVEIALEEWPEQANPVLAEICKVSPELVRNCRQQLVKSGRIPEVITVTGRDGKNYPGAIERQPRGKTEAASSDKDGGGGGGGGGFAKGKGDGGALGGTTNELEVEARQMIRNGEINPFELTKMTSATAMDYSAATIRSAARVCSRFGIGSIASCAGRTRRRAAEWVSAAILTTSAASGRGACKGNGPYRLSCAAHASVRLICLSLGAGDRAFFRASDLLVLPRAALEERGTPEG